MTRLDGAGAFQTYGRQGSRVGVNLHSKLFLVVDRDRNAAHAIAAALCDAGGAPPIVATTAAEAITVLRDITPDAAIIDDGLADETSDIIAYWLHKNRVPYVRSAEPYAVHRAADWIETQPRLARPVASGTLLLAAQTLVGRFARA